MSLKYDPEIFWNERCKKFGHTGWADSLLYRYDQPLRLRAIERILSRIAISLNEETRVLDIGCGAGDLIQVLAAKGARVTGIDISTEVVKRTKMRFKGNERVQIVTGKVEELDFPSESFDLVTSITVLQHVTEIESFLSAVQNVIKVVKKGGHMLLLELSHYERPEEEPAGYIAIRTPQEWVSIFKRAGCPLVNEFAYPQWGMMLLERLRCLSRKILKRLQGRKKDNNEQAIGAFESLWSKRLWYSLYNIARWLILGFVYPIDHWLFILPPLQKARYRLFLFRKP